MNKTKENKGFSSVRRTWRTLGLGISVAALLLLPACGGDKPEEGANAGGRRPGADRGGQRGRGGPGGRPQMAELPTMAVAVEEAARGDISTYYSATSSLDPDKQAVVLARVQGAVMRLPAEEGDDVREGQVLLYIDDAEYRHRLTQAKVALDQQKLQYERVERMRTQGLVAGEDYDNAKSQLDVAEAAYQLAALELSYTEVRAPFTGRVVGRSVDQGQNVSNGTALFTLVDMHRLLARVHVPAREFRRIRTDLPVTLVVDSTGVSLTGRIDLVSPIVDPSSGTIKVTIEITKYPPNTRPGDFAEVSIVTDTHSDTLIVPNMAVLTERDERVVYLVDGETARRSVVETGFEDDLFIEILGGIEEGQAVVIQGQRSLADGQPINILAQVDLDGDPEPAVTATKDEKKKRRRPPGAG